MACPDFSKPFHLQTDASNYGLGAILTQLSEEGDRVISYATRTLNGAELNYSATEKECLAIIWGIRKLRPYLEGYHFAVITDHMALKWLNSIESPSGRVARWALELQQYDFEVKYRKSNFNVVADALSRQPLCEEACRRAVDAAEPVDQPSDECNWIQKLKVDLEKNPQKYSDYMVEANRVYRHIPHQAGHEEMRSQAQPGSGLEGEPQCSDGRASGKP